MPIDTSILGGITLPQLRDPQQEAIQRLSLQTQQINQQIAAQKLQEDKRKAQEIEQMDKLYASIEFNPDNTIKEESAQRLLTNLPFSMADKLRNFIDLRNKSAREAISAKDTVNKSYLDDALYRTYTLAGQLSSPEEASAWKTFANQAVRDGFDKFRVTGMTDELKEQIIGAVNKGPEFFRQYAPSLFNKEMFDRVKASEPKLKELETVDIDGKPTSVQFDDFGRPYVNGKPINLSGKVLSKPTNIDDVAKDYQATARMLATASTPEQWQKILSMVGSDMAGNFAPTFNRAAVADAAKKASDPMSEYQKQSLALQRADQEIKIKQLNQEKPKDPTQAEGQAAGFYNQMLHALEIIDKIEDLGPDGVSDEDLLKIRTLDYGDLAQYLQKNTTSDITKQYVRALDEYIEARLRFVSGKVITEPEYKSNRQLYGKIYGESEDLRNQRRQSRIVSLESARLAAGKLQGQLTPYGVKLPGMWRKEGSR